MTVPAPSVPSIFRRRWEGRASSVTLLLASSVPRDSYCQGLELKDRLFLPGFLRPESLLLPAGGDLDVFQRNVRLSVFLRGGGEGGAPCSPCVLVQPRPPDRPRRPRALLHPSCPTQFWPILQCDVRHSGLGTLTT